MNSARAHGLPQFGYAPPPQRLVDGNGRVQTEALQWRRHTDRSEQTHVCPTTCRIRLGDE